MVQQEQFYRYFLFSLSLDNRMTLLFYHSLKDLCVNNMNLSQCFIKSYEYTNETLILHFRRKNLEYYSLSFVKKGTPFHL